MTALIHHNGLIRRTRMRSSSSQPAILRRPLRLTLGHFVSCLSILRMILRIRARFRGPWSLRILASSSRKMTSRLQCSRFSRTRAGFQCFKLNQLVTICLASRIRPGNVVYVLHRRNIERICFSTE